MESKPLKPVYEDFEVQTEWVNEASHVALVASVQGFKKDQVRVQLFSGGKLKISGERPTGDNKFSRFWKEIPVPSNWDRSKITAKFENGKLQVLHPIPIPPAEKPQEEAKPSEKVAKSEKPAPQPQRPEDLSQKQNNGPEQAVQEAAPKATSEKQTGEETNGVAKRPKDVSKQASDKKDSDKIIAAANEASKTMDGTGDYQQLEIFKQVLDSLVMGLKNPTKVMNMVLIVFLVVLLALFLGNGIGSLGN